MYSTAQNVADTLTSVDSSSTPVQTNDSWLKSPVDYVAQDSIKFNIKEQKVYLYGDAKVAYEAIKLNAAYIELDLANDELFAKGMPDSTGKITGKPVFEDAGKSFDSETMRYNFNTEKGKITKAITQEGEGYIHGTQVKMVEPDVFFVKNGKYTTCSHEDPHFYLESSKLKIIKDDKIVTGPTMLKVQGIPTPLAIPFGFFPNKQGRSSGILIPAPGASDARGFSLQNGGYYWGFNDQVSLKLQGDIYSLGSFAIRTEFHTKRRYRYNSRIKIGFASNRVEDRETLTFLRNNDYNIEWRFNQEQKARPYSTFSSNLKIQSANYYRNDQVSTTADFLRNDIASSISFNKSFPNSPVKISLNADQRLKVADSTVNITLPNMLISTGRIYPFRRKQRVGKMKWYENIGVPPTVKFQNRISARQDSVFTRSSIENMRNGLEFALPVATSFKVLKYFSLAPSVNYKEVWYLNTQERSWDIESQKEIRNKVDGLKRYPQMSGSARLTTIIYGMYNFNSDRVPAMRHKMTPSVNLTFRPDYADERYGYLKSYEKIELKTNTSNDSTYWDTSRVEYYTYGDGIFGGPVGNQSGILSFGLNNDLEMKVKNKRDTNETYRKVQIIDGLNLTTTYNIFKDSLNWSNIRFSGNSGFLNRKITFNYSAGLDPYVYDSVSDKRLNRFVWNDQQRLGRLTDARITANLRFKSKKQVDKKTSSEYASDEELEALYDEYDNYVDFNIPWAFNIRYNLIYRKPETESTITNTIGFSGNMNITENWKLEFNSGYDFKTKQFTFTNFSFYRSLHCWELSFNVNPFGSRKSYSIDLKAKSPLLQSLKLSRRRNWYDF